MLWQSEQLLFWSHSRGGSSPHSFSVVALGSLKGPAVCGYYDSQPSGGLLKLLPSADVSVRMSYLGSSVFKFSKTCPCHVFGNKNVHWLDAEALPQMTSKELSDECSLSLWCGCKWWRMLVVLAVMQARVHQESLQIVFVRSTTLCPLSCLCAGKPKSLTEHPLFSPPPPFSCKYLLTTASARQTGQSSNLLALTLINDIYIMHPSSSFTRYLWTHAWLHWKIKFKLDQQCKIYIYIYMSDK